MIQVVAAAGERGQLVVVGTGIQLGRHISERVVSEISSADVVFCLTDAFAMDWLQVLRPDLIPLHEHYGEGKDRRISYREMEQRILQPVRAGLRVCAVFYGHPGVFADVPHQALRQAAKEGHDTRMEPGVSAAACLYADLRIDPGKSGVQSFETTQFLIYRRRVDPSALLILWQVALCGDLACRRFHAVAAHLALLVEKLCRDYAADTPVILYEAAPISVGRFRADRMPLHAIPDAAYKEYTTLVIPPVQAMEADREMLAKLGARPRTESER